MQDGGFVRIGVELHTVEEVTEFLLNPQGPTKDVRGNNNVKVQVGDMAYIMNGLKNIFCKTFKNIF